MLLKRLIFFGFIVFSFGFYPSKRFFPIHKGEGILELDGLVTIDGKPSVAEIEIGSVVKHHNLKQRFKADANGNFETNLPGGDEYEIVIRVEKFPQQVIFLNTTHVDSDCVLNVYADFTSPEYDNKLAELIKTTREKFPKEFDRKRFASEFGNFKKENLYYKVQVGAFKFYENFNYNNVVGLPKIIRQVDHDYITRFTMGNFETYAQAQELLSKVQASEVKDAFIVAFYNGEKKFINQLVEERIVE
jgi:hypothetical protein